MKQLLFSESGGGGGALDNGTVLWENPNPTADYGQGIINLSESMANFEYIGIRYKVYKADADTDAKEVISKSADVLDALTTTSPRKNTMTLGVGTSTTVYARNIIPTSEIGFRTSNTYYVNGSTVNSLLIPTHIIGY